MIKMENVGVRLSPSISGRNRDEVPPPTVRLGPAQGRTNQSNIRDKTERFRQVKVLYPLSIHVSSSEVL